MLILLSGNKPRKAIIKPKKNTNSYLNFPSNFLNSSDNIIFFFFPNTFGGVLTVSFSLVG